MPVRTNIQLTGIKQAVAAGDKMKDHDGRSVRAGMNDCLLIIAEESQRLVPVDTSDLKNSIDLNLVGQGFNLVGYVSYGGPTAPYAWIVHEDTLAYHAPPTQAKYLSHAVYNTKAACEEAVRRQFYSSSPEAIPR